jgi:hypothetical protein
LPYRNPKKYKEIQEMTSTETDTRTVREFFGSIRSDAIVQDEFNNQYIVTGRYVYDVTGDYVVTHVLLVDRDRGTVLKADYNAPNMFSVVTEDGVELQADPATWLLARGVSRQYQYNDENSQSDSQELARVTDERDKLRRDVTKVNEFINHYAVERGYCSDYEEKLSELNDSLEVVEFEGRQQDYDVAVQLTVTYDIRIPRSASSESSVRDSVNNMDADDMFYEFVKAPGIGYDTIGFEIDRIRQTS